MTQVEETHAPNTAHVSYDREATISSGGVHDPFFVTVEEIRRVARVAAETAARFSEADTADVAMEWMDAPRPLFGGLSAVRACVERTHYKRAVTLHGLGLDTEADAQELDFVMSLCDEGEDSLPFDAASELPGLGLSRLFIAEISEEVNGAGVWAFAAMVAEDESEVRSMMDARYGSKVAACSKVRAGFNASVGMAKAFVSPALAETLEKVAKDPGSPLAHGLEIVIEQRFRA